MNVTAYPTLLEKLKSDDYLSGFVSASARHRIAQQIRTIRSSRAWSQKRLGEAASKPQNVISRLEDPSYGKVTLQTLIDLAVAFRVGLSVKFVTFGDLAHDIEDLSANALSVPSFDDEVRAVTEVAHPATSVQTEKPIGWIDAKVAGQSMATAAANESIARSEQAIGSGFLTQTQPNQHAHRMHL